MQTSDIVSVPGGGKIKSSICGAIFFPCSSIPDTQGKSEHSVNTSVGFHYFCLCIQACGLCVTNSSCIILQDLSLTEDDNMAKLV